MKVAFGPDNTQTIVTSSVGLPVLNLANSGVDIGDVDVLTCGTITPGTAASSLGKAEDAAHTTGDVGVMSLGVRKDTAASLAGTDGDYTAPIFDSTGKLHVNVGNTITVSAHAVTNAGTFAVQEDGAALTALQVIDNSIVVDDAAFTPATTSVNMAGFTFDDTTPDSVGEGDAGAARMSGNRNIYTQLRDAAGNERGANINASNQLEINIGAQTADITIADGGNTITVDGTVTANLSATDNAVLDTIATNTTGLNNAVSGSELQVDVVAALPAGTALLGKVGIDQVTANANEVVSKTGSLVALEAGSAAIGKLAANSGVDIGDVDVTSVSAGANLVGDVGISGARTSGGTTLFSNLGTGTLTQIKGSAGQLYWMHVMNLKASVLYLQVFDLASASVTLGTTTPDMVFPIPTQGDTNGAGFVISIPNGIAFGTGISFAATTTETGATTASANEVYWNGGYA